jgi:hypothetical protein
MQTGQVTMANDDTAANSNRRAFCRRAAALFAGSKLLPAAFALGQSHPPPESSRVDVAAIDHDRVLAAAQRALAEAPRPLTAIPAPRSPGTPHDYYSEPDTAPSPFLLHRDAVYALGLRVPALAAAYSLTRDSRYAEHAAAHLRAWFVDPATAMAPNLDFGRVPPHAGPDRITIRDNADIGDARPPDTRLGGTFEGILETLPLVDVSRAIPFLAASAALTATQPETLRQWFAAYQLWLTGPRDSGPRLGALARDRKDHHGSSWLLQAAAYARTAAGKGVPGEDAVSTELRHRFKTVTLRAQVLAAGTFPHELTSTNPYRDSLFNLDLLAGVCELLSTRFERVWDYQLEDGPGMRVAIAYHFPYMEDRGKWPFRADETFFNQLPGRRPSLLFAARAFARPEYAALWKSLPPGSPDPEIARTIPIQQPLLWVRQPIRPA